MRALHIAVMSLLCLSVVTAQTGVWQTLSDMKEIRDITVSNGRLIAATSGGIFVTDGNEYIRITNVSGLSDIDYVAVTTLPDGRIAAGASAGYLNIGQPGGAWIEVADIVRATQFQRRGITCLYQHQGKLYIGTEFGLAVYDTDHREFGDTYTKFGDFPSQVRVNEVLIVGDIIWVATESGITSGDLRHPNLKDPVNWTSHPLPAGGGNAEAVSMALYEGQIYAASKDALFRYEQGAFVQKVASIRGGVYKRIRVHGSALCIVTEQAAFSMGSDMTPLQTGQKLDDAIYPYKPRFTDLDSDGSNIYFATTHGIAAVDEDGNWNFRWPDGPASNFFKAMAVDDNGILWAASGLSGQGLYAFDGTQWTNYDNRLIPEIRSNTVMDVTDGPDGSVWFGSRGGGAVERRADGTFVNYSTANVTDFPGIDTSPLYPAVEGIQRDAKGNIWSLHLRSNGGLLGCHSPDGSWRFFSDPTIPKGAEVSGLAIDQSGKKWIMMNTSSFRGLLVFDDKGTLENTFDDTWTRFSANDVNGINAENDVTSIAVDVLGDIWIGTDRGLRTIFNPRVNDRVSKTCFNTRCNIEGLYISAIAIDPVNNKWLGTKDGVFVLTPDGSEILTQYNTSNSPLLDNDILDILVHPVTGIAYIATRRGLSSLSTPYSKPVAAFSEFIVSPNPFRPTVDGLMSIDGLMEGSVIKILSVSGDLVAEIPTPGGRIGFWDGMTTNGRPAASGVYFLVAATANGKQAGVTKIAVIRD